MSEEKRKNGDSSNGNQTTAYILIGLGAVFLVTNVLDINLWRLWPLVLVAIGLYMLFGRSSIGSTAKSGLFSAPLDDAETADVDLHLAVGEARVSALHNSDRLIEADLTYVGEIEFEVAGDLEKTVRLTQSGSSNLQWLNPGNWFNGDDYEWRIGLSPAVSMRLNIKGGVGESQVDLRRLDLTDFRFQGGMGETTIHLPEADIAYPVRISGGVGEVHINLPPATDMSLDIQGGVGEIKVVTPPATALRLTSRGGVGDVKVPGRLKKLSSEEGDFGLNKSGTWETPDYDQAEHRIEIHYTGGVGELKIR